MPSRNAPWNAVPNLPYKGVVVEKCIHFLCFLKQLTFILSVLEFRGLILFYYVELKVLVDQHSL